MPQKEGEELIEESLLTKCAEASTRWRTESFREHEHLFMFAESRYRNEIARGRSLRFRHWDGGTA